MTDQFFRCPLDIKANRTGREDTNVTIDLILLPLYRALGDDGAKDVTFITYHTDDAFSSVRGELHRDLLAGVFGSNDREVTRVGSPKGDRRGVRVGNDQATVR
ncbi:hypothetical protein K8I85_05125 [bacterium]|nr:hypothetical protein [bacterium]